MLKTAASMMSSMSPEQLESMMGNLPGGMKMTPEMAKMAAEKVGGSRGGAGDAAVGLLVLLLVLLCWSGHSWLGALQWGQLVAQP